MIEEFTVERVFNEHMNVRVDAQGNEARILKQLQARIGLSRALVKVDQIQSLAQSPVTLSWVVEFTVGRLDKVTMSLVVEAKLAVELLRCEYVKVRKGLLFVVNEYGVIQAFRLHRD